MSTDPRDIVERLQDRVIVDAFADRRLNDGVLAERLIRERHEAANEILRLRAAAVALHELVECDQIRRSLRTELTADSYEAFRARSNAAWECARSADAAVGGKPNV